MNYRKYLNSKHWKETKSFLSNIDSKNCYCCEEKNNLNIHHLHYKTLNYEDGDEIIYLCNNCHFKIHFLNKNRKRSIETDRDLALACRKIQSIRSKNGFKLLNDKVSKIANSLY